MSARLWTPERGHQELAAAIAALNRNPSRRTEKPKLLFDQTLYVPVTPRISTAGGLAAAMVLPSALVAEKPRMLSRRQFLSRTAIIAGGVAAGTFACPEQVKAAGFWGWVVATAAASVFSWFISEALNWATYRLTGNDMAAPARNSAPTTDEYHNRFAPTLVVANAAKRFPARQVGGYPLPVGMNEYLLSLDLNGPEAAQIEKEVKEGVYQSPLLPVSQRVAVRREDMPTVEAIAQLYSNGTGGRLTARDLDLQYINTVADRGTADRRSQRYVGVGAVHNGQAKYLVNTNPS